ncbi:GAF domain-containing protein [Aureibacillus halotolerans]|uniref:GAF domain-containing protein n=1 Tax=Aureibacillus halotolerans TaxID=1508390 RepID=A0A4V3D580_9BACI|nr:GAF domain-containing protein [Aureibacillus halotolerans]TDQ39097.1 GAF domain-containing protein [Aureibacillus halotolerans]
MFTGSSYSEDRQKNEALVLKQLQALIEDEDDQIANLANASALLNQYLENINWVGFYLVKGETLVLGPFQGLPACVRISIGKGVCGTAVELDETKLVTDVSAFPGHIACDPASKSEIVVPIHADGKVIGCLDIDAPELQRFTTEDQVFLEQFVRVLEASLKA